MVSRGQKAVQKALAGLDKMIVKLDAAADCCLKEHEDLVGLIKELEACEEAAMSARGKALNARKGFQAVLDGKVG